MGNQVVPNVVVGPDGSADSLIVEGSDSADDFFTLTPDLPDPTTNLFTQVRVNRQVVNNDQSLTNLYDVFVADPVRSEGDGLTVDALGGNNTIDASGLGLSQGGFTTPDLVALTEKTTGSTGTNRLVGSPFNDTLIGGSGTNTFTGALGQNTFSAPLGSANTLIETYDFDVAIYGNTLVYGHVLGEDGGPFASAPSPTEPQLETIAAEDDPNLTFANRGDRFSSDSIVENTGGIFQTVILQGGPSANVFVVNSPNGTVVAGGRTVQVTPFTGTATLDAMGNTLNNPSGLSQYYVVNTTGSSSTNVQIRQSDVGTGTNYLIVDGTDKPDLVTLNAVGSGASRIGSVIVGALSSPTRDTVTYSGVQFLEVDTFGGNDNVLSNDTVAPTIINTGSGDDNIVVGTVPLIPDPGNRTLEFPNGVPVADTQNMTNGNSAPLFILGGTQNDNFEVDHNRAALFLSGGAGDDRFLLKTFLVLREDATDPTKVTNLSEVFGGAGNNRYEYLQNAPVAINGGPGHDTLVVDGTPLGDTFVVGRNYIAGAGRVVTFQNIESIEIDGSGGPDDIWVLATDPSVTVTVDGGSGDDTIHLGGTPPPLLFNPPSYTYQPPSFTVPLPPITVYDSFSWNLGNFSFDLTTDFWSGLLATLGANNLQQAASNALSDKINALFDYWSAFIPNFKRGSFSYDSLQVTSNVQFGFFGFALSTRIEVQVTNLKVNYQIGHLEPQSKVVTPAPVTVQPTPFAFQAPSQFDLSQIQGQVILIGGDQNETRGDTLIVSDEGGPTGSFTLTNRVTPRVTVVGTTPGGKTLYQNQVDENGNPIVDTYVSLQGGGLPSGTDFNGLPYSGVEIQGIEHVDIRLPNGTTTPAANTLTVAEGDVHTVATKAVGSSYVVDPTRDVVTSGPPLTSYTLNIDGGNADDSVTLKQIGGLTTVNGGGGSNTLTASNGGSLGSLDARVIFNGTATTSQVSATVSASDPLFAPLLGPGNSPLVFINSNLNQTPYSDNDGPKPYSASTTASLLFAQGGIVFVRVAVLADLANPSGPVDGVVQQDWVQQRGVQEQGVQEYGKQKINPQDNQPLYLDANGIETETVTPLPEIVTVAQGTAGALPVYLDFAGNRVLVPSPALSSYGKQKRDGSNNLVYIDANGHETTTNTGLPAVVPLNQGDAGAQPVYQNALGQNVLVAPLYRVSIITVDAGTAGAQLVYLDSNGNKTFAVTSVKSFVQSLDNNAPLLYFDTNGNLTDQNGSGFRPSLIRVDRTVAIPFTRLQQMMGTAANPGTNRLIVDDSADLSNVTGSLDPYQIPTDVLSAGQILYHPGTTTDTFNLASNSSRTVNLSGTILDTGRLSVVALYGNPPTSSIALRPGVDFTIGAGLNQITLAAGVALPAQVVVNYPAESKAYFGGEPVIDPFTHQALLYKGGEPVVDVFQPRSAQYPNGVPILDPFGNPVLHQTGDPVLHIVGDPVVAAVGDSQFALGGEPVLDESGTPVLNADGSLFTKIAGQGAIHDRRDTVYSVISAAGAPVILNTTTSYTPPLKTLASLNGPITIRLAQDLNLSYALKSGDLVSVTIEDGSDIFNLSSSEVSFSVANDSITITPSAAHQIGHSVTAKFTIETPATYSGGEPVFYFGDEPIQVGQPVTDSQGNLVFDAQGVVLQTDASRRDSKGNVKLHGRGEPVYVLVGGKWTQAVHAAGDPILALGNEPVVSIAGDPSFFSTSDPVQSADSLHRLAFGPAMAGDILFQNLTDASVTLGNGNNRFSITGTHAGTTELTSGNGNNTISVRGTDGATTIKTGSGTDTIGVGSFAGFWQTAPNTTSYLDINGTTLGIKAPLSIDAGTQPTGARDQLLVDDTDMTLGQAGDLTSNRLTGLFTQAGEIDYANFEYLKIALGSGDDTFNIHSTHGSSTNVATTDLFGDGGNDTINVETIAGPTNVDAGTGNDLVRVGSTTSQQVAILQSVLGGIDNGLLTLIGNDGNDAVTLYNSGDPTGTTSTPRTGTLSATAVTGLGMLGPGVAYSGFESLGLFLGDGAVDVGSGVDNFFVKSTAPTTPVHIDLGDDPNASKTYTGVSNTIDIASISSATEIDGGDGNDVFRVNFDAAGNQTNLSGIGAHLTLYGNAGNDDYQVGLAGAGTTAGADNQIDVYNNPANAFTPDPTLSDINSLEIYGTNAPDFFLFRANPTTDLGMVASYQVNAALQPVAGGFFERVNYDSTVTNLTAFGRDGNDTFVLDDTLKTTTTTIFGGNGDDTFQVGQVFNSPRDANAGLAPNDFLQTTQTTQGFLTNGNSGAAFLHGNAGDDSFTVYHNSAELYLFGEEDDDSFLVRAFVKVNPADPNAPFTNINGGQGADFISYTVNAPVRIDGGDGLDTLTVIGTEFGDDFVVTDQGIFGAGLFITYTGIEKIVIDAGSGNDRFFIASTPAGVSLQLIGGQGSDTFNVGGGNNDQPITVVSHSLDGHSGLIDNSAQSADSNFNNIFVQGVSALVADKDSANVVITQPSSGLRLFEDIADPATSTDLDKAGALVVDSYTVVLTQAPTDPVRVIATPVPPSDAQLLAGVMGVTLNGSKTGVTLVFDRNNWFIPQTVVVAPIGDNVATGRRTVVISNTIIEGVSAGDGDPYNGLSVPTVPVVIYDKDSADVAIVPSGDGNLVAEGSNAQPATDSYQIVLTRRPTGTVSISLQDLNALLDVSQGGVSLVDSLGRPASTLTFDASTWNAPQTITIAARDDTLKQGLHYDQIENSVSAGLDAYLGLSISDVASGLAASVNKDLSRAPAQTYSASANLHGRPARSPSPAPPPSSSPRATPPTPSPRW